MVVVAVIVGLVIVAAVVALVVANPKLEQRRTAAIEATVAALDGATPIVRDDEANCYGIELGDSKPRSYGQGAAAVTADAFVFTAVLSGDTLVVPRSAVTAVEVETSHIIKNVATLVLKLHWRDPEAGESAGRWKLSDLEAFVAALGGATEATDAAEGTADEPG